MKFVCDNCKAKYQIGDDKVAGKTVRMKCRKCGFEIRVSPETAVPDDAHPEAAPAPAVQTHAPAPAPHAPAPHAPAPASRPLGAPAPRPLGAPAPAPRPLGAPASAPRPLGAPAPAPRPHAVDAPHAHAAPVSHVQPVHAPAPAKPGWDGDDESTSIMNQPLHDAVAAATGRAPAHAPRPVTAAPRPVTIAPAPRPHAPAPKPAAPAPHAPVRSVTASGLPATTATRPAGARTTNSSLAAVTHEQAAHHAPHLHAVAPPPAAEPAPEIEWFVGVGGTPIGPVNVAAIRAHAAKNEVDGDSLVWREGMAEWQPLRTFPELLELVTAAQAPRSAPAAPTPTPLAAAPAPAPAPTPAPLAAAPAPAPAPVAPLAAAPAAVEVTPAPKAASEPLVAPGSSIFGTGPATPSKQNGMSNGVHVPTGADAPAAALKASGGTAAALDDDAPTRMKADRDTGLTSLEELIPGHRRRRRTHPMAYAFIGAAMVFAGVAAFVLFSKPATQIVVVQAPAASVTAAPAASEDKGAVEVGDVTPVPGSAAKPLLGKPWPKTSSTAGAVAGSHDTTPLDTSGFVTNVPGPQATGPSGPSAVGGQLSQGEIQGVVSQNQPRVRRKCWQPALDAAQANGPKNARVSVSISISASGSVSSASASGAEKDFPGLSSCIGSMVQGWKFPPSGESSQVVVPFVFAGQ